jgi:hypothetical protein
MILRKFLKKMLDFFEIHIILNVGKVGDKIDFYGKNSKIASIL